MAHVPYLISFIQKKQQDDSRRDFSADKQKDLDENFNESSKALQEGLREHHSQVSLILQVYKNVSERIKANRQGVAAIRADIASCKTSLQCNRDELQRLWLEHVKCGQRRQLMNLVTQLHQTPARIQTFLDRKEWIEATNLHNEINAQLTTFSHEIASINALKPIKIEINKKYQLLCDKLKEELRSLLFRSPVDEAMTMFRNKENQRNNNRSSARSWNSTGGNNSAAMTVTPAQIFKHYHQLKLWNWRNFVIKDDWSLEQQNVSHQLTTTLKPSKQSTNEIISTDNNDWMSRILMVCQCLLKLNQLEKVIHEIWQSNYKSSKSKTSGTPSAAAASTDNGAVIQKALHVLSVGRAYQSVVQHAALAGEATPLSQYGESRHLLHLLRVLFDLLFMSCGAHCVFMRAIHKIASADSSMQSKLPLALFEEKVILGAIQEELIGILCVNLDISPQADGQIAAWKEPVGLAKTTNSTNNTPMNNNGSSTISSSDNHNKSLDREKINRYFALKKRKIAALLSPDDSNTVAPANDLQLATDEESSTLFRFSASSHETLNYARHPTSLDNTETVVNDTNISKYGNKVIVCRPSRHHIKAIYPSVMGFCLIIENYQSTGTAGNSFRLNRESCQLRNFMRRFVDSFYLPEMEFNLRRRLDHCFQTMDDSFAQPLVSRGEKEMNMNMPIIPAFNEIFNCMNDIREMGIAITDHREKILNMGGRLLQHSLNCLWDVYKTICNNKLDCRPGERMPVLSSEWAKDEDIRRFWKNFPSWSQMLMEEEHLMEQQLDRNFQGTLNDQSITRVNRIKKKTSLLGGQMDDTKVANLLNDRELRAQRALESNKMLRMMKDDGMQLEQTVGTFSVGPLKKIARLHESASWLCQQLELFRRWLSNFLSNDLTIATSLATSQSLMDIYTECAKQMRQFADSCLLLLHLECRIAAYAYLHNLPKEAMYWCPLDKVDIDQPVQNYINQLTSLSDILTLNLSRHKIKFIFEGVGHFVAALLVGVIPDIQRINTNGIKKMCRNIYNLQQALTSLSRSHETELIRVKQLYEMLHLNPETVLNKIIENGAVYAVYDESVYKDILFLYQRSHPTFDYKKITECIQRLQDVLRMKHV